MASSFVFLCCFVSCIARAGEAVRIENVTTPSRCAENDNVYVRFAGERITRFFIEARHPAYLSKLSRDSSAADFSRCDQSNDPSYSFTPIDVTLFEDGDYKLVGHRFARFWRPSSVDFRVGDRVVPGLHLVQMIRKFEGKEVEILVVYPSDGYWRIKPLPPVGRADTAYGSSFLVGPISEDGRPYVNLKSIAFDRADLSFHLNFADGSGVLQVAEASRQRTRVEVTIPPADSRTPFAALRSMFVSPEIADAAEADLDTGYGRILTLPIAGFPEMAVVDARFGRTAPSTHNTSAPDLDFSEFWRE